MITWEAETRLVNLNSVEVDDSVVTLLLLEVVLEENLELVLFLEVGHVRELKPTKNPKNLNLKKQKVEQKAERNLDQNENPGTRIFTINK